MKQSTGPAAAGWVVWIITIIDRLGFDASRSDATYGYAIAAMFFAYAAYLRIGEREK